MSEGLHFKAGIDNDQLKRDAAESSRLLRSVGDTAKAESARIDNSFNAIGASMAAAGGTAALGMLGKTILDTTAKFEKFGIVLRNTLGDAAGSDALDMIAQFAATTPFQLDEVTGAFIKMANQGFVPTRDEMTKLGDLASSTGKSFDQLSEAILDAQTGQFERLKEFGIKAAKNGDQVSFSFKGQTTTVENTNTAIQKYLLSLGELKGVAGANALISASLTGQLSNLEDKLAAMYNTIGKANSGVLYSAVGMASTLIENYETVGQVVLSLVGVYGAYRAGLIIANAVETVSAANKIALTVANTALTASEVAHYTALNIASKAQALLNKTMLANPYVAAAVAIAALAAGVYYLATQTTDAEKAHAKLQKTVDETNSSIRSEQVQIDTLFARLKNAKKGTEEYDAAKQSIMSRYGEYLTKLGDEKTALDNVALAYKAVSEGALSSARARAIDKITTEAADDRAKKEEEQLLKLKGIIDEKYGVDSKRSIDVFQQLKSALIDGNGKIRESFLKQFDETVNITDAQTGSIMTSYTANAVEEVTAKLAESENTYTSILKKARLIYGSPAAKITKTPDANTETDAPKEGDKKIVSGRSYTYTGGKWVKDKAEKDDSEDKYNKEILDKQKEHNANIIALERAKISDKAALIAFDLAQMLKAIDDQERAAKAAYDKMPAAAKAKTPFNSSVYANLRTDARGQAAQSTSELEQAENEKVKSLLEKYRSLEQQKLQLEKEYDAEIKLLDAAALKAKTQAEKDQIKDTKAVRKTELDKNINDLNSQILKSSDFYSKFFESAAKKGYATLKNFSENIGKVVNEASIKQGADGKSFAEIKIPALDENGKQITKTITITLEELGRLKEKLTEFDDELGKRNPFERMSKGFGKLSDAIKASQAARKTSADKNGGKVDKKDPDVSSTSDAVGDAVKDLGLAFNDSLAVAENWGDSLGKILGGGFEQAFKEITAFVKGAGDIGFGIGKIATGDIIGGITQTLSGVAAVYQQITSWKEKQVAIDRKIYLAEMDYQRALSKRNIELVGSVNLMSAFVNEQEQLNWLIEKGFIKEGAATHFAQLGEKFGENRKALDAEIIRFNDLANKLRAEGFAESTHYADSLDFGTTTQTGLEYYLGAIQTGSEEMQNKLAELDEKGFLKGATKEWYDAWVKAGASLKEFSDKMGELREQMQTLTLGSSFDDFLSGVASAMDKSKTGIVDFADFTETTIKTALLNSFKYQVLSELMKPLYDELSVEFVDNFKNPDSTKNISKDWIAEWSKKVQDQMGGASTQLNDLFNSLGVQMNTQAREASSKGFASMSQQSADELNGRFTAMQGHTYTISESIKILTANSAQTLKHLAGIETNTARLEAIENGISSVKQGIETMNIKGLIIRT